MPMSAKGAAMKKTMSKFSRIAAGGIALAVFASAVLVAQIEGPKRGIAPVASTGDFEVVGIEVEGTGKNADEARRDGWEKAQRIAWKQLWAKNRGGKGGSLSDSTLNGIVSAIVVEEEQLGPRRYVAKLGVVFDRARAGQLLGVRGITRRSAPLMVLPIMWDGGAPISYEQRTSWQNAWAKFNSSDSRMDYVRPSGSGGDSLLLNAGQIGRRSRLWWRTILEQFGAADVLYPIVKLDRSWPGGPVVGRFVARFGPDSKFLGKFELRANSSKGIPAMMAQGVKKMDVLYQAALAAKELRTDSSLVFETRIIEEENLDVPDSAPTPTPSNDGDAPPLEAEPLDVLDQAVRDVSGQADNENPPITPPVPPQPAPDGN